MKFSLRPTEGAFYELFTRAAANLVKGTALLQELALPGVEVQSVAERLEEVEHDSDQITHDLYKKINSTFVTPFDREDIYALASGLDDVMDYMEEAVDLTMLYEVDSLPTEIADQVDVLQRCAELTAEAMPRLKSMKDLEEYWIEINRLENAGDKSYRRILARLYSGELEALEVLRWKGIVEALEGALNTIEDISDVVESIVLKHA